MLRISPNFTDRLYFTFLFLVTVGLFLRPGRVPSWDFWVLVNLICATGIAALTRKRQCSSAWEFFHDWYPLLMFIVCFEEVSHLSFLLRDRWQDHYLLNLEAFLFRVPPTEWLERFHSPVVTELMDIGYFSYFVLLIIVGGVLYRRGNKRGFRQAMDATVLSYLVCYAVFILFPTEGPAYTLAAQHLSQISKAGPFHWMVLLIQQNAGVHGNAFPSAHVAGAVVALTFAWRYIPKLGMSLTPFVILLCIGAVYDRYHYLSDVVAGVMVGGVPAVWGMARYPVDRNGLQTIQPYRQYSPSSAAGRVRRQPPEDRDGNAGCLGP